jgi:hypothetical protein
MSESSWYDPQPARRRPHVRRRDKVEVAIAVLLISGLIVLLVVGVPRDDSGAPQPATSAPP